MKISHTEKYGDITKVLFWSRNAAQSEWVDWEWHFVLDEKTIDGIQPYHFGKRA